MKERYAKKVGEGPRKFSGKIKEVKGSVDLSEAEWNTDSELIKNGVFELSGPNNSITTKIDQVEDYDMYNCMVVERVMGAGKHTISMKLDQGSADNISIFCGVVGDGKPCNGGLFAKRVQ